MRAGRQILPNLVAALLASALLGEATPGVASPGPQPASSLLTAVQEDLTAEIGAHLRNRAEVNARDELGATALAWAVIRDNTVAVRQLLDAGADPNLVDVSGVGPLGLAVASDERDIVALLLDKGADTNAARSDGETPLMTAARLGSAEVVRMLMAHGADPNLRERRFGQTALMWASGKPEIVRMLLDHGADVHAVTKAWEVSATNYTPITYTLGVTGIPWNNDGEYKVRVGGLNALLFAVQKGDLQSAQMLIDAGVDVNQASADGTTPLLAALYNWRPQGGRRLKFVADVKIANLLLDRGAKADVADQPGYTPLHGAVLALLARDPGGFGRLAFDAARRSKPNRPHPESVTIDDDLFALAKRLLEAGADPNRQTRLPTPGPVNAARINPAPPGSSPFHLAAASRCPRLVSLMAAHGADANLVRRDGHTPLSLAVLNNDLPVVEELVAHGGDLKRRYDPIDELSDPVEPKTQARKGQTILHIAAVSGSDWVVGFLAAHGAPTDAVNGLGETAFDLADAQERYRFAKDREGPGGIAVKDALARETQTSQALRKVMHGPARPAKAVALRRLPNQPAS